MRELEPGEVVVAHGGRLQSFHLSQVPEPSRCIFEHVYFARPDSTVFGDAVRGMAQDGTRLPCSPHRRAKGGAVERASRAVTLPR